MSYLDENHSRATISANALPRYHRVLRPGWRDRLMTRFKRPEVTLPDADSVDAWLRVHRSADAPFWSIEDALDAVAALLKEGAR